MSKTKHVQYQWLPVVSFEQKAAKFLHLGLECRPLGRVLIFLFMKWTNTSSFAADTMR